MPQNNDDDPIGKALGLTPIEKTTNHLGSLLEESHNDSAAKDFEYARANIYEVINEGKEAMFKLGEIASSSQHPRCFEVYAKLMDTMLNANKELMNLQTKIREIKTVDSPISDQAKTVHNNNLFVGSTAELQKMLSDIKNGTK